MLYRKVLVLYLWKYEVDLAHWPWCKKDCVTFTICKWFCIRISCLDSGPDNITTLPYNTIIISRPYLPGQGRIYSYFTDLTEDIVVVSRWEHCSWAGFQWTQSPESSISCSEALRWVSREYRTLAMRLFLYGVQSIPAAYVSLCSKLLGICKYIDIFDHLRSCLSVCLFVCLSDASFESLDVGSSHLQTRYISRKYGSSSYMKV